MSLKSIHTPLIATDASVAQLCHRVRPVVEHQGVATFKLPKAVHERRGDADRMLEVGLGVWGLGCCVEIKKISLIGKEY